MQKHIIITGLVTNVSFRFYCKEIADKLGLKGTVRNTPAQEVDIIVQGDEAKIKKFTEFCKKGPSGARIDDFLIQDCDEEHKFDSFTVKR